MRALGIVVSVLAASFVGLAAHAATYHLIAKMEPAVLFIDSDTIRRDGTHVTYWATIFLFEDGGANMGNPRTAFVMFHDEVDCTAGASRHLSEASYDAKGVPTNSLTQITDWVETVPDSNQALENHLARLIHGVSEKRQYW